MFSRSALSSCRQSSKAVPCRRIPSRSLATVTDTASSAPAPHPPARPQASKSGAKPQAILNTAVILNRSPIITRTPTPFERAYWAYHSRIRRALYNPFPYEFYFKQGSLLEGKFVKEERAREREAFGMRRPVNKSKAKAGEEGAAASADAEADQTTNQEEAQEPMPRIHQADLTGDTRSLDRQAERNIYLLLLGKDVSGKDVWRFPQDKVADGELLHEAAERYLQRSNWGALMDTWVVSRNPIGVYEPSPPTSTDSAQDYTFFHKAHILAGQVHPDGKDILDFAWLTKQEIEPRLDTAYWTGVKDMLSDF